MQATSRPDAAATPQAKGRSPRRKVLGVLRRLSDYLGLAACVLLWWVLSAVYLPSTNPSAATMLPSPVTVASTGIEMLLDGSLVEHILASLRRVAIGFGAATALAVPLGIAMGWWQMVHRQVDPVVEFLRPIPPLAWIPLSILWFGIGDLQNQFIIFLGVFFPVMVNTISAVRGVEPVLVRAGLSLGAGPFQLLRRVVVPASLPGIFTGMRVGLGVGWMALVAAELVAARSGLGFLINDSRFVFRTDKVLVGMAVIGILGLVMDRLLRRLQSRLTPWAVFR